MSDFFPTESYPGIFATHQWVDAWEGAWSDIESIRCLTKHNSRSICRDGFYVHRKFERWSIKFTTLFSAGISTSACPSIRSEYFNLQKDDVESFLKTALSFKWDQLYVPDIILSSPGYIQLCESATANNLSVKVRDTSISYAVLLRGNNFKQYLQGLGANTRLKLFNKRKNLYRLGDVHISNMWPNLNEFIELLNQFHTQRWGKPCYEGRNLKQISNFLTEVTSVGGVPDLSVMYLDNKPISVVLDIEFRGRIYNIQSGFTERFPNGISLGTLHFGFQLERAFESDACFYDFMAGDGKNSNYKKALATHSEVLVSIMIVRSSLLKFLYVCKDLITRLKS